MAVRIKVDVLERLKSAGYNTNKIRKERILGESTLQKIRSGEAVLPDYVDTICRLLDCQPGDIMEYVPDGDSE